MENNPNASFARTQRRIAGSVIAQDYQFYLFIALSCSGKLFLKP